MSLSGLPARQGDGARTAPATSMLLVEDNPIMRQALRRVLDAAPDFRLVGEAEDTDGAVRLAGELRPELVLMDLRIPGAGGIEATRRIKRRHPETVVVAWTAYSDRDFVHGMLEAGASGYLLKGAPGEAFLSSLRTLRVGGTPISPAVAESLIAELRLAEENGGAVVAPPEDGITADRSLLRIAGRVVQALQEGHPGVRLLPAVRPEDASSPVPESALFALWLHMARLAVRGHRGGWGILGAEARDDGVALSVVLQDGGATRFLEPEEDEALGVLRSLVEEADGELTEVDLRSPTRIRAKLPLPHGSLRGAAEQLTLPGWSGPAGDRRGEQLSFPDWP